MRCKLEGRFLRREVRQGYDYGGREGGKVGGRNGIAIKRGRERGKKMRKTSD